MIVLANQKEITDFLIGIWAEQARDSIKRRKKFFVALAGGNTPVDIYRGIGNSKLINSWDKTQVFLTDERFVPLSSKESNYRMVRDTILDHIDIPPKNIHPVYTGDSAEKSAREYEQDLIKTFALKEGKFPDFDLILLGVGEDGHIASLLPGSPALKERKHLALGVYHDRLKQYRVTLTLPVINNARRIVFLVTGKRKAGIIKDIILEKALAPASLVKPENKNVLYLLDREASLFLPFRKKAF
ncbi:MAG: 6-phosphogluconolactonase [Candidatus Omnitrophica bacterium]|nr:6-phosphogluconolactonase [Candidatus Omnitrophota bacterium]